MLKISINLKQKTKVFVTTCIVIALLLNNSVAFAAKKEYRMPKSLKMIGIEDTKSVRADLPEITVAIIDGGLDIELYSEYFKKSRISDESINLLTGETGIYAVWDSEDGHGTAIASVIAKGTPDNVKLMIIKGSDSSHYEGWVVDAGVKYAIDHGADIINICSNGTMDFNPGLLKMAHEDLFKRAQVLGIPIICSAGNDGDVFAENEERSSYPVGMNFENIIGVGSLGISGNTLFRSEYSNQGYFVDYEVVGEKVLMLHYERKVEDDTVTEIRCLEFGSGTSCAAPVITCAVCYALMEYYIDGGEHQNENIIKDIERKLNGSCRDIDGFRIIDVTKIAKRIKEGEIDGRTTKGRKG